MDEERWLLIAMVEAHAVIRETHVKHGVGSRESFMASVASVVSVAFEWTVIKATKYVEPIRVKIVRFMSPSTVN